MNQRKLTRKEKLDAQRKSPGEPIAAKKKTQEKKNNLPVFVIALLGILLYANSLQNEFALDDYSAIKKNWVVKQGVSAFPTILTTSYRYGYREGNDELYRPLPLMIFATLWQFFPENPFPFHLVNVLLYAFTGVVLFRVLRKLFEGINPLLPFVATIVFIAHPLHTEVVANIKSMDEILSFLFVLLSIEQLFKYIHSSSVKNLITAWIYFFIAFLSKEGTITMLAVIPLIFAMFTNASKGKIIQVTLVLSTAALVFLAMRYQALGSIAGSKKFLLIDNVLVKAPDAATRLATVFFILFLYIRLMLFPHPLSSDHSYKEVDLSGWGEVAPWISLVFFLWIAFLAIRYYKSNKIISFSILFFFISMSLYSNLVITIGSSMAERFLYVPLLSFGIVTGWLFLKIFKVPFAEIPKPGGDLFQKENRNVIVLVALLVIPYSGKTISRNTDWKNSPTLFSRDIINAPKSALLHFNYANELKAELALEAPDSTAKNILLDSAISEYKTAIELYPGYSEAFEQLGLAYYYRRKDQEAFVNITKAIEMNPMKATAYNSLGSIYFDRAKNYEKALELFQRAVQLYPSYVDGWRNLGCTYGTLGQPDKAIDAFQRALKYDPSNADVLNFMVTTYRNMGNASMANTYMMKLEEIKKLTQ